MRQLDLFSPDQDEFRHGYRLIERLEAELGHFRQAEDWYLDALEQRPEDSVLRCQYGDLLWHM
ncbi:MAG: hypothetical protein ABFS37_14065, partial [Acidobacteriota bacterium]